jgi:predicted RNA-binding Zn-ribbon protein involved in translation (DUF1610 family)
MTLRESLDARMRRDKWITIAALVPCAAAWLSASPYAWVGPAAFIVFGVIMYIRSTAIPCPRCGASLGRLGYRYFSAIMGRARGYYMERAEQLGKCPHCGLRLDEEIGPAPK